MPTAISKTKLFCSFTGTLYALESGKVTREDLASGLFVFGCGRDHAMHPLDDECVESIVTERPDLHQLLVAAMEIAETQGRVRWRTETTRPSFAMVDDLLVSNGYKPLMSEEEYYRSSCLGRNYCYQAVEGRSTELEVIWRG
ncbi:MAG: hypothetical protein K2X93_25905 [Candidatus Obscuribacterales bacterium]|nr:hypothetical protein [Candidatus Obscuribacterales bacterium]